MKSISKLSIFAAALAILSAADWDTVQKLKLQCLSLTAQHAMEQQKTSAAPPAAIALPGDAKELPVELTASPRTNGKPAAEFLRIKLPSPVDMISRHSGLAVIIQTTEGSSPEVRLGVRLFTADGKKAEIRPVIPALSAWGDQKAGTVL